MLYWQIIPRWKDNFMVRVIQQLNRKTISKNEDENEEEEKEEFLSLSKRFHFHNVETLSWADFKSVFRFFIALLDQKL